MERERCLFAITMYYNHSVSKCEGGSMEYCSQKREIRPMRADGGELFVGLFLLFLCLASSLFCLSRVTLLFEELCLLGEDIDDLAAAILAAREANTVHKLLGAAGGALHKTLRIQSMVASAVSRVGAGVSHSYYHIGTVYIFFLFVQAFPIDAPLRKLWR